MSMMPPGGLRRIDQKLFTEVPGKGVLGRRLSRPQIVSKCNASLRFSATLGENSEVEVPLV